MERPHPNSQKSAFPPELLELVGDELDDLLPEEEDWELRKTTGLALCETSKDLCRLGRRLLYGTLTTSEEMESGGGIFESCDLLERIDSIIQHPHLARHVRELEILASEEDTEDCEILQAMWEVFRVCDRPVSLTLKAPLVQPHDNIGFAPGLSGKIIMEQGFLVLTLIELQTIEFEGVLEKVKDLGILANSFGPPLSTRLVSPVLAKVRNVESLHLRHVGGPSHPSLVKFDFSFKRITTITLCTVDKVVAGGILEACPALITITLETDSSLSFAFPSLSKELP